MKIAIIGYGKMGIMVEQAAIAQGHTIAAAVESRFPSEPDEKMFRSIAEAGNLGGADVAIEFTEPGSVLANIKALAEKKIPAVIGTTGWYDRISEAQNAIEIADSSLLWASNFSIGVNIFYRIAWYAAELANSFPEYDVGGFETHHNKKLDSPSGTARTLVDGVIARMKSKNKAVWETLNRRPELGELHFPSLRIGSVPGVHSLLFDSPADTIEITHTARNREGFASGAVHAAEWLLKSGTSGKRKGFFTIDDMLKDILG